MGKYAEIKKYVGEKWYIGLTDEEIYPAIQHLIDIIEKQREALECALEGLREYASQDDTAGMNGSGCFCDPMVFIKPYEEVITKALKLTGEQGDGRIIYVDFLSGWYCYRGWNRARFSPQATKGVGR